MMDKVIIFGSFSEDETVSYQQASGEPQSKSLVKKANAAKKPSFQTAKLPVATTKAPVQAKASSNGVKPTRPPEVFHAVTPIRNVSNQLERASLNQEKQPERDAGATKTAAPSWASLVQPAGVVPRGLVNTGNSCYLNSTLQALLSCPLFWRLLKTLKRRTISAKDFPALYGFAELVSALETSPEGRSDASTREFQALVPSMFDPFLEVFRPNLSRRQEDAPEFLCVLLDHMHNELFKLDSGSSTDAVISVDNDWHTVGPKNRAAKLRTCNRVETSLSDIFGGQQNNTIKTKGEKPSIQVEPFFVLSLDISSDSVHSVKQALIQNNRIVEWPKLLILQLMRFGIDGGATRKLMKEIDFPERLIIERPKVMKYELMATIMHHGRDVSSGHYTTDAKHGDSWLRFDDRNVSSVNLSMVLNKQAYVLFYQKL